MHPDRPMAEPRRSALDDLRRRLARLPDSHPSSANFGTRAEAVSAAEAVSGAEAGAGFPSLGEGGEQAERGTGGLADRLGRLDRLSRLLGGGERSRRGHPAAPGSLLPGPGEPGPYRPWFAPGELGEPWFRPDPSGRSD